MNLKSYYEKHFLGVELILSLIFTLVIFLVCYFYFGMYTISNLINGTRLSLYGAIAGSAANLLGFVITGLSVLLAFNENESMKLLKQSKYYSYIFKVFFSSSKYLGMLVLISLLCMIFDSDKSPSFGALFMLLWACIITILRLIRCIWILENLVYNVVIKRQN